jgi:putative FmdB family regulatory protein
MPLFEYRCDKCEHKFALLEGVSAEEVKRECPHCGSRKLTKLISRIARTPKSEDDDFGDGDLGGADDLPDLPDDDYGDDDGDFE